MALAAATPHPATTVFVAAHATDDGLIGPYYAAVEVTDGLIHRLRRLHNLLTAHDLSEVRVATYTAWQPEAIAQDAQLRNDELVVVNGQFWFTAQPRHADGVVETKALDIENFLRAVGQGQRCFGVHESDLEPTVNLTEGV